MEAPQFILKKWGRQLSPQEKLLKLLRGAHLWRLYHRQKAVPLKPSVLRIPSYCRAKAWFPNFGKLIHCALVWVGLFLSLLLWIYTQSAKTWADASHPTSFAGLRRAARKTGLIERPANEPDQRQRVQIQWGILFQHLSSRARGADQQQQLAGGAWRDGIGARLFFLNMGTFQRLNMTMLEQPYTIQYHQISDLAQVAWRWANNPQRRGKEVNPKAVRPRPNG